MSQVISILAMSATILIAWGLDNWVNLLKKQALADFSYNPLVWGTVAANLLIAVTWVLLVWWILKRNPKSKWVSIIYLITGLIISIIVPLQLTVPDSYRGLLLFEETRYIRLVIMGVIGLTSRFTLSAAFICILGGISLLIPNKKI